MKFEHKYRIHFTARFSDVHAFSCTSAESERIWMKSGALWVRCEGLALADFWRDPRSSDSWRARRNVVFLSGKQHTISPISRRPKFTKFEHDTFIYVAMKTFETEFLKFNRMVVFPKKRKNYLHNFLRRPTRVDNTTDNADISHLQLANHHRLLSHVILGFVECTNVGIPHNTAI